MISLSRADMSFVARWWWNLDRLTLAALFTLLGIGYVLALAATPGMSLRLSDPHMQAMLRQIVFLLLGGTAMVAVSMLSLRNVRLTAAGMLIVFFVLTGFTLVHGMEVDGANRWLSVLPGFTIQPSEFLRPAFIIISARLISEARVNPGFPGRAAAFGLFALVAILLKMQPDIGMTFLFAAVVFTQFYLDGMKTKFVGVALLALAVAGVAAFFLIPHVHHRVMMFWYPQKGSQPLIALSAFGHGGMFGLGPGEGQVKQHLPDARADFVFAVAGEEFGLFFCAFIIFMFAAIVLRAMRRLMSEPNHFVVLAAGGLIVAFGLQAFINMSSSLSLIPTKGMTLPFISYGGSSVLAISVQMGLLLALTRRRFGDEE